MTEEEYPGARRAATERRTNAAIAAIFLLAAGALVGGVLYERSRPAATQPAAPVRAAAAPAAADAGASAPEPLPPPGADAEAELRRAAGGLSTRPEWEKWLAEPQLIARLAASVHRVAEGENVNAILLPFLAPDRELTAESRDGKLFIAPEAIARYATVTEVVTSIDPAKAAAAYTRLAPFFAAAFREVARPGERFTPVLHGAIRELTSTPVPADEPSLVKNGSAYFFEDSALQNLAPAQKQLLRLGNVNARKIQQWLTAFDRALSR